MASQVLPDGTVLPPFNISAPVPQIDTNGFKWDSVDQVFQRAQPAADIKKDDGQTPLKADPHTLSRVVTTNVPLALSATPAPTTQVAQDFPFPLKVLLGSWTGNGFNQIFRPRPDNDKVFPNPQSVNGIPDNVLELNLTTEQHTFGPPIGNIPNRGSGDQSTIILSGIPYLQTIQDVTNPNSGLGDRPTPTDIHFETGIWLVVPQSASRPKNGTSIVRMASIPHGTTILAQGLAPQPRNPSVIGGQAGPPNFDAQENQVDSTPFQIQNGSPVGFPSMDDSNKNTFRVPQDLKNCPAKGSITSDIIKNPNLVLKNAIKGQKIIETLSFQVFTGIPEPPPQQQGAASQSTNINLTTDAILNGGGTANISFLAGTQSKVTTAAPGGGDQPNAFVPSMTAKYWIEFVEYRVNLPRLTTNAPVTLRPTMTNPFAPTPIFTITPPPNTSPSKPVEAKSIAVPGLQLQYSQIVRLNFATLTWPHISVATLVPKDPQLFQMK